MATEGPNGEAPGGDRTGRRRFRRACLAGVAVAAAIELTLVLGGGGVTRADAFGNFYEIQARALLDGDLAVPEDSLKFEGFVIDGRTYLYFGPLPAVARMPLVALADESLDGQLTGPSMLAAWAVLGWATSALLWRVRGVVRGDEPVSRAEAASAGLLVAGLLGGSVVLFLSGRPIVYHEAELWGMALGVASAWGAVGLVDAPTRRRVVVAGLLATATTLTRSSVGLGATAAVGVVAIVLVRRWWRSRSAAPRGAGALAAGAVLATVVALGAGVGVNLAKFHTPFGIPIEAQVFTEQDQRRQAMLAANDGRYFRLAFVPTTALQYLRPDGIGFRATFPFFEIPDRLPTLVGDLVFDERNRTSSMPVSYPGWTALGLVGAVALGRRFRRPDRLLGTVGPVVVATSLGVAGILTIGYLGNRYLADLFPTLALLGAAGAAVTWHRLDHPHRATRGGRRRGAVVTLGLLTLFAVLANGAIGATNRHTTGSPARLRTWLALGEAVDARTFDSLAESVRRGTRLPKVGGAGDLFVTGDCDSLYWSDGTALADVKPTNWRRVEGTAATGFFRVEVRLDGLAPGDSVDLLEADGSTPNDRTVLRLEVIDEQHLRPVLDDPRVGLVGAVVEWASGTTYELELSADPALGLIELWRGDERLLVDFYDRPEARVGPAANDGSFPGEWRPRADDTSLCRSLLAEEG